MAYGKNNTKKAPQRETKPPALIAWHVAERGENKFWNRIGAAWEHEDGEGLTLQLDLLPGHRRPHRSPGTEARGGGGLTAPFFLSASPKPGAGLRPFLLSASFRPFSPCAR